MQTTPDGLGVKQLYFDGTDGTYVVSAIPAPARREGDIFLDLQFPLHSGRIAGIPGRIFISVMGLAVAGLSVTGVVIWLRRRGALVTKKTTLGKSSDRSLAT